jgi:hypothetical protein
VHRREVGGDAAVGLFHDDTTSSVRGSVWALRRQTQALDFMSAHTRR